MSKKLSRSELLRTALRSSRKAKTVRELMLMENIAKEEYNFCCSILFSLVERGYAAVGERKICEVTGRECKTYQWNRDKDTLPKLQKRGPKPKTEKADKETKKAKVRAEAKETTPAHAVVPAFLQMFNAQSDLVIIPQADGSFVVKQAVAVPAPQPEVTPEPVATTAAPEPAPAVVVAPEPTPVVEPVAPVEPEAVVVEVKQAKKAKGKAKAEVKVETKPEAKVEPVPEPKPEVKPVASTVFPAEHIKNARILHFPVPAPKAPATKETLIETTQVVEPQVAAEPVQPEPVKKTAFEMLKSASLKRIKLYSDEAKRTIELFQETTPDGKFVLKCQVQFNKAEIVKISDTPFDLAKEIEDNK